jgi:hypothetical protein
MRNRIDYENREPLQVKWNRRIRNSLYAFIPKSMGFSQALFKVPAGGDILRLSHGNRACQNVCYLAIKATI